MGVLETWRLTNRLWLNNLQKLAAIAADIPRFFFSPVLWDLGVTLDKWLTFAPQIHHPCHHCHDSYYYQLHQLHTVVCTLTSRQFHDNSSTDISSTDISSTTAYQRVGQLYIQLLFQIIIFINSNFYLHYDSFLSIPLPLTL